MKPANGAYSLTTDAQPGLGSTTVRYVVTDDGIDTTFGRLLWVETPPPGMFALPPIALRFEDSSHFTAINGSQSFTGSYAPA